MDVEPIVELIHAVPIRLTPSDTTELPEVLEADDTRCEYCEELGGTVRGRPEGMDSTRRNHHQTTLRDRMPFVVDEVLASQTADSAGAGVSGCPNLTKRVHRDQGVDLSGRHRRMSQKFLDHTHIRTPI